MHRNLYDTDCITWSPQGRVFQVDYAKQAVTQGTCCVGLRSSTHVVLCALRKAPSKLAGSQQKIFEIDEHIGVAISGITADAKIICEYMRISCLQHRFTYLKEKSVESLVLSVADKCQANTQRSGKRPFGVGLLVAGYDASGPHLFETSPSGDFFEYIATAFGSRSQSAKTYLERHFTTFENETVEGLVLRGLHALKASLPSGTERCTENCLRMGRISELPEAEVERLLSTVNVPVDAPTEPAFSAETRMEVEH